MKSNITPKFSIGQEVKLIKDFKVNENIIKSGSICDIIDIELSDSKFADIDEIYKCDYIDFVFWISEDFLAELS